MIKVVNEIMSESYSDRDKSVIYDLWFENLEKVMGYSKQVADGLRKSKYDYEAYTDKTYDMWKSLLVKAGIKIPSIVNESRSFIKESVRINESVGYDVSGTTPTGAGDYSIDEKRGISDPAKAIELWFKIEAKHPLNTDISAYKKDDAIALITWAHENQDKIAEWHKQYGCPYKLESMLAAIERQFNNGCRSFHENEYGEMIDPFCIG